MADLPSTWGTATRSPSSLKLLITSWTRSGLVNATLAICSTSIPCADSSTICARRHVTTDPELRLPNQQPLPGRDHLPISTDINGISVRDRDPQVVDR